MYNRRNHYRILQVQPDASDDVIRHNYKILLRKLGMHPDLGGDEKDATMLNLAYETVSRPEKRAAYDRWLFQHYDIETLSLGHLKQRRLFPGIRKRPPAFAVFNGLFPATHTIRSSLDHE